MVELRLRIRNSVFNAQDPPRKATIRPQAKRQRTNRGFTWWILGIENAVSDAES